MLSNYVISAIRTYVPLLAGYLLTVLAESLHIVIDPSSQRQLIAFSVVVLSAAYYALARLLEHRWPKLGVLLGIPAKPVYATVKTDGSYVVTNAVQAESIPADPAPVLAERMDDALSAPLPTPPPAATQLPPSIPTASPAPDQATAFGITGQAPPAP